MKVRWSCSKPHLHSLFSAGLLRLTAHQIISFRWLMSDQNTARRTWASSEEPQVYPMLRRFSGMNLFRKWSAGATPPSSCHFLSSVSSFHPSEVLRSKWGMQRREARSHVSSMVIVATHDAATVYKTNNTFCCGVLMWRVFRLLCVVDCLRPRPHGRKQSYFTPSSSSLF